MSSEDDIRALVRRRGICRATLTRMRHAVQEYNQSTSLELLHAKLDRLAALGPEFSDIQCKLENIDEPDTHTQERIDFEDSYDETRALIQQLINARSSGGSSDVTSACTNHRKPGCTLPKINLPQFAGDITQFTHFHDIFTSLIVNNPAIENIEKFHYLLSSLRGLAHELVKNIPLSTDNFNLAWDTLCQRYHNPKLIVNAHISLILGADVVRKETATGLRQLLNQVQANLKAVQSLQLDIPVHELLIMQIVQDKLPESLRKFWEMSVQTNELPSLQKLFDYIEKRAQTLELIHSSASAPHLTTKPIQPRNNGQQQPAVNSYVSVSDMCVICHGNHHLSKCRAFLQFDIHKRNNLVKQKGLCFNCLRVTHSLKTCPSKSVCKRCNGRHNTLLHKEYPGLNSNPNAGTLQQISRRPVNSRAETSQDSSQSATNQSSTYCTLKAATSLQVLLSTALIQVKDKGGRQHLVRCLLDSASQTNFVTESLVQTLGLRKRKNSTPIEGISQSMTQAKYSVMVDVESHVNNTAYRVDCLILHKITSDMPSQYVPHRDWNLPANIQLADPQFYQPAKIDLLLGTDIFFHILKSGKKTRAGNFPVLQDTEFGWLISGNYKANKVSKETKGTFFLRNDLILHKQVQRFWETEEVTKPVRTQEEIDCEQHFVDNVTRDSSGRYVVKLPFKENTDVLGDSWHTALKRFQSVERRLNSDAGFREEYNNFLTEYEQLQHMEKISTNLTEEKGCYLPHHPVFKSDSSTTKTRVVFDASCKTKSGKSLNDILMAGPTIQDDLCSIVTRFRTYRVCFTADIEKMFRQVKVDPQDSKFQRILWRSSPNEPMQGYQLQTVTYGTTCAPFLATRCLQQLAQDEGLNYPMAAPVLLRDFYMDDCISGAADVNEAILLQRQLIQLLSSGGFNLRKWCSNNSALLESVPEQNREMSLPLSFNSGENVKTLGLLWHPGTDTLQIASNCFKDNVMTLPFTKRKVLSVVSSIYDPLGVVSPIVITFKMFLQQLWQLKLSWDDELPAELLTSWEKLISQLHFIKEIHIPRFVLSEAFTQIQLHGFSDASMTGFGACLYIRTISGDGQIITHLLCARSKVAPLNEITLPRLELCAAVLLARLVTKMCKVLPFQWHSIHLWSDSTIVLAWLAGNPSKWKIFVAHRVAEIQSCTSFCKWKHVSSRDNPADMVSRGVTPSVLIHSEFWFRGPSWLSQVESSWPTCSEKLPGNLPETRKVALNCMIATNSVHLFSRFSSHFKLQRTIAYCLRFIYNSGHEQIERKDGPLSVEELQSADMVCVKLVQSEDYREEISRLSANKPLQKQSKLLSLTPFIDKHAMLRVGGRLENSNLSYETKHQIILPASNHFTYLLIKREHERLLHGGMQVTLASLRLRYWIVNAKSAVRKVIHQCTKCFRFKTTTSHQLMGQLPSVRVCVARPFLNVGIDFTGPVTLKLGSVRSKTVIKGYVCIIVCMATKAVHLEAVTSLSTEAFLAALRRFIARRGICHNVYSDNGSNFLGAQKALEKMRNVFLKEETRAEILNFASSRSIKWHFIPPHSPNFGGLWERGVRSLKHHLRRTMGSMIFNYEELSTLLAQIEACLNSRPLQSLSDDPNDLSVLTPGHFLIGQPLTTLPDSDRTSQRVSGLARYNNLQRMLQTFWKRWSSDYLTQLQQRSKWSQPSKGISAGTVVLVKEDNVPPLGWPLGLITATHPGRDGVTRVVTVKFGNNAVKRPVSKVVPLPFNE